jgi:Putative transposase of IS4/5 family (DUF4096)
MGVQRKSYPTDLTDDQWEIASHLIPPAKTGGRPRTIEMREVVNALMYLTFPVKFGLPTASPQLDHVI